MPVTREDIIQSVNSELENHTRLGSGTAEADGTLAAFLVAPHGYHIVDDTTFAVYLNSSATTDYTMDFDSGICTLDAVPSAGTVVSFLYNYTYWPDDVILNAINAGINNLFPSLYRIADYDIVTDGVTYEYDLPEGIESVSSVKHRMSAAEPWKRYSRPKRFQLEQDGASRYLRFYNYPDAGFIRVSGIYRPAEFTDTVYESKVIDDISIANPTIIQTTTAHGFLEGDIAYLSGINTTENVTGWQTIDTVPDATHFTLDADISVVIDEAGAVIKHETLESTCRIPDRARFPIISYACYYVLTQKNAPRIRTDVAVVTQGRGVLSPRQINDASQAFMMRYQLQLNNMRMRPWREN